MRPKALLLALSLIGVLLLLAAPASGDASEGAGGGGASSGPNNQPSSDGQDGGSGVGTSPTDGAGAATPAGDPGDSNRPTGSVNPLSVRNPFCDEGLDARERRNCRVTGTPEGRYPTSNYGFDIHIDTGLDNIVGNFQALLAQIANAIWLACLFVFNLVLTLLGWAFGLTPFSDNETMASIDRGLEGFYRAFTEPWLVVAMVAIGACGLWRGVVRREVSASIASTALSIVLMLLALWILHEPRETVGKVSGFANDAALEVLAAPQGGSANPKASYAQATAEVWSQVTIPGFAALNFSDADWALSEPDPEMLKTADSYVCLDAAYLAQIPPGLWARLQAASADGDQVHCDQLAGSLPAPRTNAEMYLRSSPGSLAREKLWSEHTDDAPYSSYLVIQGDGGAWARLPLVVVIALGLLGGICLLSWLALRLLVQTAVAFVLVLMAPLALFMPAFGERGRAAFGLWGGTLAGALIAKLVYAALLAVVLFATTVIATLVDDVGAMVAFLVTAGIWWAIFLRREALVSFMSVSRDSDGAARGSTWRSRMLGLETAAGVGRRMASPLTGAAGGGARAARNAAATATDDRAEAGRRVARQGLDERAKRRLDERLVAERSVIAAQESRRDRIASLGAERVEALKLAGRHRRGAGTANPADRKHPADARQRSLATAKRLGHEQARLRREVRAGEAPEARARMFVSEAEERERRRGQRWSAKDLADAREAIRSESDRPVDHKAHAWRVGMTPERYASLRGAERERAHGEVHAQLRADRAAFGAIPSRPDGIVDPADGRRWHAELRRQPGGERALRDARREVAHRRRARRRMPNRRGVSR